MANVDQENGDDRHHPTPDIWIESQKLLKNSEIIQREHVYHYGYSTLVFVGSHFGVSFFNSFCE